MQAGDHLISPRPGFSHHGIYVGNNEVIHYAGYSSGEESGQVVLTSLEVFRNGHPCRVATHNLRRYYPSRASSVPGRGSVKLTTAPCSTTASTS